MRCPGLWNALLQTIPPPRKLQLLRYRTTIRGNFSSCYSPPFSYCPWLPSCSFLCFPSARLPYGPASGSPVSLLIPLPFSDMPSWFLLSMLRYYPVCPSLHLQLLSHFLERPPVSGSDGTVVFSQNVRYFPAGISAEHR